MNDEALQARVAELEVALKREQERSCWAERRCELLEASVRRAYAFANNTVPRGNGRPWPIYDTLVE